MPLVSSTSSSDLMRENMDRKTKILFVLYMLAGLFSLVVLIVPEVPIIANNLVDNLSRDYGSAFRATKISVFKIPREHLPPIPVDQIPKHPADKAEVIIVGDSFFGEIFGTYFEKLTGTPVFAYELRRGFDPLQMEGPVDVLKRIKFKNNSESKYLVYERVERHTFLIFDKWINSKKSGRKDRKAKVLDNIIDSNGRYNKYLKSKMINTESLEYLVTENPVVDRMLEIRNTLRFSLFREISKETPVYSVEPPMIFMEAIAFSRMKKTDEMIERVADNIAASNERIYREYGLKMIFMPVPNKYTIYRYRYDEYNYNVSGESYDDFLPRLYKELDKRDVLYVDLYHDFMESKELLYHASDAHWNPVGALMAVSKLKEVYEQLEWERLLNLSGQGDN